MARCDLCRASGPKCQKDCACTCHENTRRSTPKGLQIMPRKNLRNPPNRPNTSEFLKEIVPPCSGCSTDPCYHWPYCDKTPEQVEQIRRMVAHYWNGVKAVCECGSENTKYIKDVDHDDGTCEVIKCLDCGKSWHNELPD